MRLRGPSGQPIAEYIGQVAAALYYRDGIHSVGVDRVADTAGLTKRTIYRHYRSKDELIAGALRYAPRVPFPEVGSPVDRILGVFDLLEVFLTNVDYRGCPYIIYTAELTERTHPARKLIERYIAKRREWFVRQAMDAGLDRPEEIAEELDVLFDGAVASGAKRGDLVAVKTAKRLARMVIAAATSEKTDQRPPLRARSPRQRTYGSSRAS